jgi:hypothetical protein
MCARTFATHSPLRVHSYAFRRTAGRIVCSLHLALNFAFSRSSLGLTRRVPHLALGVRLYFLKTTYDVRTNPGASRSPQNLVPDGRSHASHGPHLANA